VGILPNTRAEVSFVSAILRFGKADMFDTPVFKVLSPNDTGAAPGHQGGIVVPKDIEDFFPDVVGEITAENPTADVTLIADLIVEGRLVDTVSTRYQYQTWGGTRSPERRLTSNLGPLRNIANADDLILIARDIDDPFRIAITLVRANTVEYQTIRGVNPAKRWGVVSQLPVPVSNAEIRKASQAIAALPTLQFNLHDLQRPMAQTLQNRKIRNAAFRRVLLASYGVSCQVTNESMITMNAANNLDAAHIVPIEAGGTDDPRNGLILSKDIHWAFDKGLFSIGDDFSLIVPNSITQQAPNLPLARIAGQRLNFGASTLRPHRSTLEWHRNHRLQT
jgi:putative restriction endonuclease